MRPRSSTFHSRNGEPQTDGLQRLACRLVLPGLNLGECLHDAVEIGVQLGGKGFLAGALLVGKDGIDSPAQDAGADRRVGRQRVTSRSWEPRTSPQAANSRATFSSQAKSAPSTLRPALRTVMASRAWPVLRSWLARPR